MIHAIILAGGWGRRFWPKSQRRLPKQLLRHDGRHSPIQNLFNLIKSAIPKERIWVVTNKTCVQNLRRQLLSLPRKNFLVEPQPRNTAAAVGLASMVIRKIDPQAVTIVLSSDHLLGQKRRFLKALKEAARLAKERAVLVTIGIRPDRPAEEFGYLKLAQSLKLKAQSAKIYKVERFIEKPSLAKAKKYVKSKRYLWNSGIFVWRLTSIFEAMKKYLPKLYSSLQKIEKVWGRPECKRCLVKEYKQLKEVSIDYGVMEKARNIFAVVGKFAWQDLGSWSNLSSTAFTRDRQGNLILGLHRGIDTDNSFILSENKHLIGTVGVRDLIIVHTPSATLVCRKDKTQEVKQLTKILEKDKHLKKYL